jgi:alcohol dehydrogenase
MLGLIASGRLQPQRLVTRELGLDEAGAAFADLGTVPGIAVVTRF